MEVSEDRTAKIAKINSIKDAISAALQIPLMQIKIYGQAGGPIDIEYTNFDYYFEEFGLLKDDTIKVIKAANAILGF